VRNYIDFIKENKITHKKLDNRFWDNLILNDNIRNKLLEIAEDFYNNLELKIDIHDVKLTGSIANYNYHKNSDLDVHIIIDLNEYDGDTEVLLDMIKSKTFIWNLKHDINIRGADVELYIQDKNESHISTGLYSLKNTKWIKEPKYTDPEVDDDDVKSKYDRWVFEILKLEKYIDDDIIDDVKREYFDRSEKLKKKLSNFRKKGLHKGNGEFSVENVTFKKLRRDGYIDKLYDVSINIYDSIFSQ